MLLRNFGQIFRVRPSSSSLVQMKQSNGVMLQTSPLNYFLSSVPFSRYAEGNSVNNIERYPGLALGTGTTAPTIDDYKMENYLDDNSLRSVSSGRTIPVGNYETPDIWVFSQTVENITQQDLSITEIGLFTASSVLGYACFLLTRDVINPVVIAPGETKTFVVTIDFTQAITSVATS